MSLAMQRKQTSQVKADLLQNTLFGRYWRMNGTLIGRGKEVSIWVSVTVVINVFMGVRISVILGEARFTSITAILTNLMWVTFTFFIIILFHGTHSRLLKFLRLDTVNSIESSQHLQELQAWAGLWLGWRLQQFLLSFVFALIVAPLGFYAMYPTTHRGLAVN